MTVNAYTRTWFKVFLAGYAPAQTEAEVAFIARQLPLPTYQNVLDLCCGTGRHALPLAARGYRVTGVDRDPDAIAEARSQAVPTATFLLGDMRHLAELVPGPFDAAICMWQSFGYFDPATNAAVLGQLASALRPHGLLILDIYHREFFAAHQGVERAERDGRPVVSTRRMSGDRLTVRIDYGPDLPPDVFEWQLYTPHTVQALAADQGLDLVLACTWCDETRPATAESPRMQVVFEKR